MYILFNSESGRVELNVYNLGGKKIKMLISDFFDTGERKIIWDTRDISQGIYFLKLKFNDTYVVKKLLVLR
ncbi:MAG: T9SS type A sorting domain-containing protein [bacterium]|nr:T9SS type A sorting domain-containing protein [bacterium]